MFRFDLRSSPWHFPSVKHKAGKPAKTLHQRVPELIDALAMPEHKRRKNRNAHYKEDLGDDMRRGWPGPMSPPNRVS